MLCVVWCVVCVEDRLWCVVWCGVECVLRKVCSVLCGVECVLRTGCGVLCVFVVVWFTVNFPKAVLILIPSKRSVSAQYCQLYTISEHHEPVPAKTA